MKPKKFRESCGIDVPEWNNIIDKMLNDYAVQELKLCNLGIVMPRTFTLTWKDAQEEPPKEGGRYWCLVREINDLGTSYYQWNCSYNERDKRWASNALYKDVVFWTELAPRPI